MEGEYYYYYFGELTLINYTNYLGGNKNGKERTNRVNRKKSSTNI